MPSSEPLAGSGTPLREQPARRGSLRLPDVNPGVRSERKAEGPHDVAAGHCVFGVPRQKSWILIFARFADRSRVYSATLMIRGGGNAASLVWRVEGEGN